MGWLAKPEDAKPVALEVTSEAERLRKAQADFGKAERAPIGKRTSTAPCGCSTSGRDGSEPGGFLQSARRDFARRRKGDRKRKRLFATRLSADPQFQEARFNLARIPFKKHDYGQRANNSKHSSARPPGGKQQRHREELIRYRFFSPCCSKAGTGAAQKAMEEFKMMDDTPALYYAQAAWAFQHGNPSRRATGWRTPAIYFRRS